MMKYDLQVSNNVIKASLTRIINQVYKLLPMREEKTDWQKPLQTIIEELVGMKRLLLDWQQESFFTLLCKLEGMFSLADSEDFGLYRRTIFECLNVLGELKQCLN